MSYRHVDEIDRAVFVARKALSLGHLRRPAVLTRFLYQRWYLGLTSQQVEVPVQRGPAWRAWSPDWDRDHDRAGRDLVRLYLSCAPRTSLHAIALVCERANEWDVPWKLASTAMSTPVPARDATVVYLPLSELPAVRPEIDRLVTDLQPFLGSQAPALTLRIGRGASLAQNTADGRSFGLHRCSLVAASVLSSQQFHHREQVERTMRVFEAAGIDPRRPYLERATSWDRPWVAA